MQQLWNHQKTIKHLLQSACQLGQRPLFFFGLYIILYIYIIYIYIQSSFLGPKSTIFCFSMSETIRCTRKKCCPIYQLKVTTETTGEAKVRLMPFMLEGRMAFPRNDGYLGVISGVKRLWVNGSYWLRMVVEIFLVVVCKSKTWFGEFYRKVTIFGLEKQDFQYSSTNKKPWRIYPMKYGIQPRSLGVDISTIL